MKRFLALTIVSAALVAMPASQLVSAKGHVPSHKEQVCHRNRVITVGAKAVSAHVGHGDIFIDKMTHLPPLFTGDFCDESDG